MAFSIAALIAFGASYVLLRLGLSDMASRYVIATSVAYLAFLLVIRFIASAIRRGLGTDVNPLDALDFIPSERSSDPSPGSTDGDDCVDAPSADPTDSFPDLPVPDLDEGLAILVPLLVLGAGVLSALYVVYVAPVLLAELVLDVLIASRLARRFERIRAEQWYYGALRHTYKPFLGLLVTVALAGFVASLFAPGADSIGDIFQRT